MKQHLMVLCCTTALCAAPAHADDARDDSIQQLFFNMAASNANTASATFASGHVWGLNYVNGYVYTQQSVLGDSWITAQESHQYAGTGAARGQTATASSHVTARSVMGISKGLAEGFAPPPVHLGGWAGYSGGGADFRTGWLDVWNVGGGSGQSVLTMRGHFDLSMDMRGHFDFGLNARSVGSHGTRNASFSDYFNWSGANGITPGSPVCSGCSYTLVKSADGKSVRVDYQIQLSFWYGDTIHVSSTIGASNAGPLGYSGHNYVNALSTSSFDALILPSGASLSTASGDMSLINGQWMYAAAVPEPSVWALAVCGLIVLPLLRRAVPRHGQPG